MASRTVMPANARTKYCAVLSRREIEVADVPREATTVAAEALTVFDWVAEVRSGYGLRARLRATSVPGSPDRLCWIPGCGR